MLNDSEREAAIQHQIDIIAGQDIDDVRPADRVFANDVCGCDDSHCETCNPEFVAHLRANEVFLQNCAEQGILIE